MTGQRPARAAAGRRELCVVLHDVAPARWDGCTQVLARVRALAREAGVTLPVTLLVVPQFHGATGASEHYLRWLHRAVRDGHELALHGLTHHDDGPPPVRLRERLLRRVYTASEGEFAALDHATARQRLAQGRAWAREHGLAMRGFVAPAWLLSEDAWDAVASAGFDYTCTLNAVVALPQRQSVTARSLVFSTRSFWRRALSVAWVTALAWQQRHAPLLRLELHPHDCDHPAVMRCWSAVLARALRERQPVRMSQAAAWVREAGTPPAKRAA